MDYTMIKAGLSKAVPLNSHLNLELLEVGDGHGVVRLPSDPRMLNHVGSQHAAGLFAAAEFASGAAMTGALVEHLANATPLAAGATITYKKLAKGPILATARLSEDKAAIIERLTANGRAEFTADIDLTDEAGVLVATMTVQWNVRKRA
jgi:acyl-coenzyme A thioesterase PaaI-like protein